MFSTQLSTTGAEKAATLCELKEKVDTEALVAATQSNFVTRKNFYFNVDEIKEQKHQGQQH